MPGDEQGDPQHQGAPPDWDPLLGAIPSGCIPQQLAIVHSGEAHIFVLLQFAVVGFHRLLSSPRDSHLVRVLLHFQPAVLIPG